MPDASTTGLIYLFIFFQSRKDKRGTFSHTGDHLALLKIWNEIAGQSPTDSRPCETSEKPCSRPLRHSRQGTRFTAINSVMKYALRNPTRTKTPTRANPRAAINTHFPAIKNIQNAVRIQARMAQSSRRCSHGIEEREAFVARGAARPRGSVPSARG